MNRINFIKSVKMHHACSCCDLRPAMRCILFENGYAYASDGHIAVRHEINEISNFPDEQKNILEGKLLHKDSYRKILKYNFVKITEAGFECLNSSDGSIAIFPFFKLDVKFPNAEEVVQKSLGKESAGVGLAKFAASADKISRLCKALGDGGCKYLFTHTNANDVIIVRTDDYPSSIGLLMPIYND